MVETTLSGLKLLGRGKVRDIYEVDGKLLLVASDRLSAFDVVMPDGIPGKGKVLNQISAFWFRTLGDILPNHMISIDVDTFPPAARAHAETLRGRSMLCRKAKPFPVECVVRGYLSGSGWAEYKEKGEVCGIALPKGLRESDRLPEPIFTPATKEEKGHHDENITFDRMVHIVGKETAEKVRSIVVALYNRAAAFASGKGILIADTKFELGTADGELILIDEALTPDSSRFWPAAGYEPGGPQKSFDKQFVRDYLLTLPWNKTAPGPRLPAEVVEKTALKYREALTILTGKDIV
ncbi:phosphoribosylaminoimidazolesuccinocarboxamide synthase [Candidatus Deferrimicrobium sp.]|uniref:phosphoribosylaminoimidazolesuccinocarboxamide synthase n=1 Tax=Candidatus Deferrimicrobium sp. TaxID=3060586 RepID=UPI003C6FEC59